MSVTLRRYGNETYMYNNGVNREWFTVSHTHQLAPLLQVWGVDNYSLFQALDSFDDVAGSCETNFGLLGAYFLTTEIKGVK